MQLRRALSAPGRPCGQAGPGAKPQGRFIWQDVGVLDTYES